MASVRAIDVKTHSLVIDHHLSVTPLERKAGPPERRPGMTVGIADVHGDAPHGGERHCDGDEILYVFSGRLRVTTESEPDTPVELGPGDACIVAKGEWHRVQMIEPAQLLTSRQDHTVTTVR